VSGNIRKFRGHQALGVYCDLHQMEENSSQMRNIKQGRSRNRTAYGMES